MGSHVKGPEMGKGCEKVGSYLVYIHTLGHYHPPSRCGAHEGKHSAIPGPWLPYRTHPYP